MKTTTEKPVKKQSVKQIVAGWKKDKGIKLIDLKKRINNDDIKIDFKHHNTFGIPKDKLLEDFKYDFNQHYNDAVETYKKMPDNFFAAYRLYKPIEFGKYIDFEFSWYCWDCDARLRPVLIDENTLTLIDTRTFFELGDKAVVAGKLKNKFDFHFKSLKECPNCALKKIGIKDKKFVTEINLPSGELAVVNFFNKKELYEDQSADRDFNSLLGRIKLAQKLEKLDIGFGQMSNMSIDVYVKNDRKEIIFANDIYYDEETGEEIEQDFRNYTHLGSISCDVWRWQCADLEILKKHNEKLPKKSEINYNKKSNNYHKMIVASVQPGRWIIEHYYDINPGSKIYSKLFLKNNK